MKLVTVVTVPSSEQDCSSQQARQDDSSDSENIYQEPLTVKIEASLSSEEESLSQCIGEKKDDGGVPVRSTAGRILRHILVKLSSFSTLDFFMVSIIVVSKIICFLLL